LLYFRELACNLSIDALRRGQEYLGEVPINAVAHITKDRGDIPIDVVGYPVKRGDGFRGHYAVTGGLLDGFGQPRSGRSKLFY
jgi:hypothetical protein